MQTGDTFQQYFTVSEKVYHDFLSAFGDENPLHTDTDFAGKKGFDSKVMHGNILNGFVSYFVGMCLPTKDVIIHSQEIKFHKPVYMNNRLDFKAEIIDFRESVNMYEIKFVFRNEAEVVVAKGVVKIGII